MVLATLAALVLMQAPAASSVQGTDGGQAVYAKVADAVLLVIVEDAAGDKVGQGSAFVIEGGLLVTNAHVVRGGKPFIQSGILKVPCAIEKIDETNDLAVLKPAGELSVK